MEYCGDAIMRVYDENPYKVDDVSYINWCVTSSDQYFSLNHEENKIGEKQYENKITRKTKQTTTNNHTKQAIKHQTIKKNKQKQYEWNM